MCFFKVVLKMGSPWSGFLFIWKHKEEGLRKMFCFYKGITLGQKFCFVFK